MSIEAMKQALEHVQEFKRRWWAVPPFGNKVNKATREAVSAAHSPIFQLEDALRVAIASYSTAIEQMEKQEHSIEVRTFGAHATFVTREPLAQYKNGDKFYRTPPAAQTALDKMAENERELGIQMQPVQEPMALNAGVPPLYPEMKDGETISVEYTIPPAAQRQWVSLTDEKVKEVWKQLNYDLNHGKFEADGTERHVIIEFYRAIEAKLREENGGNL